MGVGKLIGDLPGGGLVILEEGTRSGGLDLSGQTLSLLSSFGAEELSFRDTA